MATDFGDFINMAKSRARSSGGLSPSQRASNVQNFMKSTPFNARNAASFLGGPFGVMNSAVNAAKNSQFGQSIANKGSSMPTGELDRSIRTPFDPPENPDADALLDRLNPNGRLVLNGQSLIKNPNTSPLPDESTVNHEKWPTDSEGRRQRHYDPYDTSIFPDGEQRRNAAGAKNNIETAIRRIANMTATPAPIIPTIIDAAKQRKDEVLPDNYADILLKNNPDMSIDNGFDWLEQKMAYGPVHVPIATDYDPNTLDHYQDYDYPGGFSEFMHDTWPRPMRTIKDYGEEGAAPFPTIPSDSNAGMLANMIENGTINMTDPSAVINLMPSYGIPGFEWGPNWEPRGTKENYINTILRRNGSENLFAKRPGVKLGTNGYFVHPEYPNILPPREPVMPYQDEDDMYIYGRG